MVITSKSPLPNPASDDPANSTCNCEKSKCLRLYCRCFQQGNVCGPACGCRDCLNRKEHAEVKDLARREINEKNPFAFSRKLRRFERTQEMLHVRGCICKRTQCIKNYCECFASGVGCSRLCKCAGCKNKQLELNDDEVKLYYEKVCRKKKRS